MKIAKATIPDLIIRDGSYSVFHYTPEWGYQEHELGSKAKLLHFWKDYASSTAYALYHFDSSVRPKKKKATLPKLYMIDGMYAFFEYPTALNGSGGYIKMGNHVDIVSISDSESVIDGFYVLFAFHTTDKPAE